MGHDSTAHLLAGLVATDSGMITLIDLPTLTGIHQHS
jgi:hypothetical protein